MMSEENTIYSVLSRRFNVSMVVRETYLSKQAKAELFLLGAEFRQELIMSGVWNVAIINDTLYILDQEI